MIKSITRGNGSIGSPDTVTEVSGFGLDFQTLEKDLREAFGLLGQEEGGGLVLRAGRDVLLSLGLRIVSESKRGLVADVRYCGALCFLRETFTNSADWWTVSRDAPAKQEETAELAETEEMAAAASAKARGEKSMEDLKAESIRRQVDGRTKDDRPRDTPVQLVHEIGYISLPPDAGQIKQGLQKAFASLASPLGDGLVISASNSALEAMLDLNLLKWGTRFPVQTLSPRDDFGANRYFLNARVVKSDTLGPDIWRVSIDRGQEDTPKLVSEGVTAPGTSAAEAIEQLLREEASTAKVGASIGAAIEILQEWDKPLPPLTLGELTKDSGVRQKLDEAASERALAAAHEKQESDYEDMTRLLTREPDPELVAAFGEAAPDGDPKDPRSGPAAMLRADLRILITRAREQNAREGVKCRELSVAIANLETAYLWIGEMSAGEGHSLDFTK